ncbi:hypothetical protein RJ640_000187 [Escallonia rubra]|uniref:Transposase (putative) gypsy type domain-containing protein n=1 Tax=Escallonia rubra TaxID=112253 RepID=A0AA88R699_9ASTE|nr:hypothetical protein RJ640_000187 [Escallonia rubra]
MTKEELEALLKEYPLPKGWIARVPELQEPVNYGIDWEMAIYEEQLKSGYELPLHPFSLKVFDHYKMVTSQLVPNGWMKLVGLIYLVKTSGSKVYPTDFLKVFFELCFVKGVSTLVGTISVVGNDFLRAVPEMASSSDKALKSGFIGVLQKAKRKKKEKAPSVEQPPTPKRTKVNLFDLHPLVIKGVSIYEDPIFRPRWTIRHDIPLDDFVRPPFESLYEETILPSEARDVTSQAEKDDQPGAASET